jgi:MoxR-like ATPase
MMQPMRVPSAAVPTFVEVGTIRAAAEAAGLRLPDAVYGNVASALNAGKHLLLTGGRGVGKTWLALAITRAAAQAGKARGATVVTGAPALDLVVDAASRGRWVIVDELDQSDPDAALSPLSSFLAGVPVTIDGEEAAPADGWRIVATWNGEPPRAQILRRFALVDVPPPASEDLRRLLEQAASGDQAAVGAAERLAETGLGTAVLLDAARHAAARNAVAPTDEPTLAREVFDAYAAPLQDP